MRYAQVTYVVTFEHDDSVPAEVAALNIAAQQVLKGDVINVTAEEYPRPLSEAEVIEAMGGCGECEACKENREALATRAVMEGSALARIMGQADPGAVAAEQAAINRARHTS